MWAKIQVDLEKYESMKSEIEVLKTIENNQFARFVEFVDRLADSRVKTNIKYALSTFIQLDLERMRDIEMKLNS